jgi:hypothetical protein
MEKYVRIIRDEDLVDLAPVDIVDGGRKRKNNITPGTARRKFESVNYSRCHVRSHYSHGRRISELILRIYQEYKES